jgi:hypothetical protein
MFEDLGAGPYTFVIQYANEAGRLRPAGPGAASEPALWTGTAAPHVEVTVGEKAETMETTGEEVKTGGLVFQASAPDLWKVPGPGGRTDLELRLVVSNAGEEPLWLNLAETISVSLKRGNENLAKCRVLPSGDPAGASPKPVVLLSLERQGAYKNYEAFASAFADALDQGPAGGSVRFAYATSRSVGLSEAFDRPLVIGYVGFDVPILKDGELGPPLSTLERLERSADKSLKSPESFSVRPTYLREVRWFRIVVQAWQAKEAAFVNAVAKHLSGTAFDGIWQPMANKSVADLLLAVNLYVSQGNDTEKRYTRARDALRAAVADVDPRAVCIHYLREVDKATEKDLTDVAACFPGDREIKNAAKKGHAKLVMALTIYVSHDDGSGQLYRKVAEILSSVLEKEK